MNIAKIFSQSLGVSSDAKTFLMVCRFRTDGRSNEFDIRLNDSGYPFQKKLSSIRMAWAIYSKTNAICSNGLGYPILGDPGAVSRAGRKGATKVSKLGRKSPWVPTLTGTFPNGQANAGS